MGPVLRAIESGHFQRIRKDGEQPGLYCRADGEEWPCRLVVDARRAQRDYAERLRQQNAVDAGKLSLW